MAKINVDSDFDIDTSAAHFTRSEAGGGSVADVFAPQAMTALADATKDIFVETKKRTAETKAKSLLEEFTGEKRFIDIAERESAILEEEKDVALQMSKFREGEAGFEESATAFRSIQDMKTKLETEREAVVQGLLDEDEYRKRAESSFYQQVALTPGLKEELAKVMGEHLGIDPRGQSAKMTMDARKDLKNTTDTARKKIIGVLVDSGYWNDDQSDQANIIEFWPHVQKGMQAQTELKVLGDKLKSQKDIDEGERNASAKQARKWVQESEQMSLYNLGSFEGHNLFNMTPEEIVNMDPAFKAQWLAHVQANGVQFSSVLNSLETGTQQSFATNRDTVTQQVELLTGILSSEQLNDGLTGSLNAMKSRNEILIEAAKAGIALSQPEAVKLSAYGKFFNISNMLTVNVKGSQMVLTGLNGDVPNLNNLDPVSKDATLKMYQQSLAGVAKAYENDAKSFTPADIGNSGNVAAMVASQSVDAIDDKSRMQLFRLAAQDKFMEKLEAVNPKQAQLIKQGVIQHQAALGQSYNKEIDNILSSGDIPLDSLDFHLEKGDAGWMVMPNPDVDSKLVPQRVGPEPLPHQKADIEAALGRKAQQHVDSVKATLVTTMNRTRGMIDNLVKSRAQVTGLSPAEAAKSVAKDLGIAISGEKKGEKQQGFAEQAGLGSSDRLNPNKELDDLKNEIAELKKQIAGKE